MANNEPEMMLIEESAGFSLDQWKWLRAYTERLKAEGKLKTYTVQAPTEKAWRNRNGTK